MITFKKVTKADNLLLNIIALKIRGDICKYVRSIKAQIRIISLMLPIVTRFLSVSSKMASEKRGSVHGNCETAS